jgi:hypothetical protein
LGIAEVVSLKHVAVEATVIRAKQSPKNIDLQLLFGDAGQFRRDIKASLGPVARFTTSVMLDGDKGGESFEAEGGLSAPRPREAPAKVTAALKDERRRHLLALALETAGFQVSYAGQAEAPDGKADVLELVDGTQTLRLFLDAATRLPRMIEYRDSVPAMFKGSSEATPATMFLADHKRVSGMLLPHSIRIALNGTVEEEWTDIKFKMNAKVSPADFRIASK